jgi:hypothetical protein
MRKNRLVNFGIFSLGISYGLYFFIQYFLTPIIWIFNEHLIHVDLISNVFSLFNKSGLEVFTIESIKLSLLGLASFYIGFFAIPPRVARVRMRFFSRDWNLHSAKWVFWALLLMGYGLKLFKVVIGVDIDGVVESSIKHGFFESPLATFFLSMNWFHLMALIVINIAYQEAKCLNNSLQDKFKLLAYGYSLIYFVVSFCSGSKASSLFPFFSLILIKCFYIPNNIRIGRSIFLVFLLVASVFAAKQLLAEFFRAIGYDTGVGFELPFTLFYALFNRLNMSHIIAAVVESGSTSFPDGTLGQFWVEMRVYGTQRINVFDGNIFGHVIGVARADDFSTGFASTNMGDLFINYEFGGVFFGMLITGFLYKLIFENSRQFYPFYAMLYASLWPILMHGMESPISVLYSTSLKMIILSIAIQLLIMQDFYKIFHYIKLRGSI